MPNLTKRWSVEEKCKNLDCELSVDELRIFKGVEGFSDHINEDLIKYAKAKAAATEARLAGHIQSALQYESACDRIYSNLPEYAMW